MKSPPMHHSQSASILPRLVLALILLQPGWALAQFGLGVIAEIEHIENPLRQVDPGEDEVLSSLSVAAQLARQTKSFGTQLNYSINRQEYERDILNDQTLVDGSGSLTWNIMPTFLTWSINNTRSNQLVDSSQPDILDNRQVVDHTSTGPNMIMQLGRSGYLNLSAQTGVVDFGKFESLKHKRNSFNGSYTRQFNQRISLSLQSSYTEADYTNTEFLSYDTASIQGQLQFNSGNLSVITALGTQNMDRMGSSSSSPIRRLDITYQVNTRIALTAAYADSVEDLLSDLNSPSAVDQSFVDSDIALDGNFGSTNIANVYQRRERSVGASYTVPSSYSLSLRYSNNDRRNLDLISGDEDERLSASFNMPVGNRLTISSSVEHSKQKFAIGQIAFERTGYRFGVNYRITDRFNLVFNALESNQVNSDTNGQIDGRNISLGISFAR